MSWIKSQKVNGFKKFSSPEYINLKKLITSISTELIESSGITPYKGTEIIVSSLSDLPTASGGFIDLEDYKTYRFQGIINTGTNTIRCGISNTIIAFDKSNDGIMYTGSGDAIYANQKDVSINNILIVLTDSSAIAFHADNTSSNSVQIRECILSGGQLCDINNGAIVAINNNILLETCTYGCDVGGNISDLSIALNYFKSAIATRHIDIYAGIYDNIKITENYFNTGVGNTAVYVRNVTIINNGGGYITSNSFYGNGDYVDGITVETLYWIIETNGPKVKSTSERVYVRKIRNEYQLQAFLLLPDVSDYIYEIDGMVEITQSINVPSTGISFVGYGNNFSTMQSSTPGLEMFTGGGNLFFDSLRLQTTGLGSKLFNIDASSAPGAACEFTNVNFENCEEIGTIKNYRQGLLTNGFFSNISKGFTLDGTWSGGFRVDTTNAPAFSGDAIFKAGPTLTFGSRFVSNANTNLVSPAIGYQFIAANFLTDASFQLDGANLRGSGTYVSGINRTSVKSYWKNNIGVDDTFPGIVIRNSVDTITNVLARGVYYELEISRVLIENTWFSSNNTNTFSSNYDSSLPINTAIKIYLSLQSGTNNELQLEIRNYKTSLGGGYNVLDNITMTSNGGTLGTRAEPVALETFSRVELGDDIRVFIRNNSAANNILLEQGSKFIINKR